MHYLKINGKTFSYDQLHIDISSIDLPHWLEHQVIYPKVYFDDRDQPIERAAVGNILSFLSPPIFDEPPEKDVRFYGGMHFQPPKIDNLWSGFPQCLFWLPSHEIVQTTEKTWLVLHFINEPATLEAQEGLNFSAQKSTTGHTEAPSRTHELDRTQWQQHIDFLLQKMQAQEVRKVVLARTSQLTFLTSPSVWEMVGKLKSHAKGASIFSFQLMPQVAFFGATPEKLYHRQGREISIDAVAGTSPVDNCAQELLRDPKETYEFGLVKHFIDTTMQPLSEKLAWQSQDTVITTSTVQHIYNQLRGTLHAHVNDRELIAALHPTPAMGGYPRNEAVALLAHCENFDRGWYAAPVGWISHAESRLLVAIRSALLRDKTMNLFAGAGIVPGSIADKEWLETQHKMNTLSKDLWI